MQTNMKLKLWALGLATIFSASSISVVAADDFRRAEFLGSTAITGISDRDIVRVNECRLKAIQLRVKRNNVEIDRVVVVYGNGERDQINVRERFARSSASGWKRLDNNNRRGRCIKKIVLVGSTDYRGMGRGNRRDGMVEVWGRN